MNILETEELTKKYGNGISYVEALKPTNLKIKKGEFIAIIGQSGSGKSTLLHLLGGLDRPTSGKVIIEGEDIYSFSENRLSAFRRKQVGFIFQSYNLIPVLSAEENITLPLTFEGEKIDKKYVDELIEFLGLKERRRHFPNELSGGQQQRVAIARALVAKPSIILADEPTGNLDTKSSDEVLKLLKLSIKKYNQTLIMITHNPYVAATANRIINIEDGIVTSNKEVINK